MELQTSWVFLVKDVNFIICYDAIRRVPVRHQGMLNMTECF